MFENIDWSTERVAQQTLARAHEIGLPMHVLPTWYDVDDIAALRTLLAEIRTGHSFDARLTPNQPEHTAVLLDTLLRETHLAARLGLPEDNRIERIAV